MGITVRVIDLGKLQKFVTKEDMQAAGKFMLALQKKRIARGEGSRGSKMKRYSKAYQKERAEAGLPINVRTLRRTGSMLESRAVLSSTDTETRIGFKKAAPYVYVNQARTPFVKATKTERNLVSKFTRRVVRERLRKQLAAARAGAK